MRMAGAGVRAEVGLAVDVGVMFMDCPEYMDRHGTARCGLPAAVEYRYTVSSMAGLLEGAKIRCPRGHWFSAPIEALTWEKDPSTAGRTGRPGPWRPVSS